MADHDEPPALEPSPPRQDEPPAGTSRASRPTPEKVFGTALLVMLVIVLLVFVLDRVVG